ncbi:MAG: hypothetical protein WBP86_14915 [Thiobacillaceae bacterium]
MSENQNLWRIYQIKRFAHGRSRMSHHPNGQTNRSRHCRSPAGYVRQKGGRSLKAAEAGKITSQEEMEKRYPNHEG